MKGAKRSKNRHHCKRLSAKRRLNRGHRRGAKLR